VLWYYGTILGTRYSIKHGCVWIPELDVRTKVLGRYKTHTRDYCARQQQQQQQYYCTSISRWRTSYLVHLYTFYLVVVVGNICSSVASPRLASRCSLYYSLCSPKRTTRRSLGMALGRERRGCRSPDVKPRHGVGPTVALPALHTRAGLHRNEMDRETLCTVCTPAGSKMQQRTVSLLSATNGYFRRLE
jgi:hypothetical protein